MYTKCILNLAICLIIITMQSFNFPGVEFSDFWIESALHRVYLSVLLPNVVQNVCVIRLTILAGAKLEEKSANR